jgi:hypothetical protein
MSYECRTCHLIQESPEGPCHPVEVAQDCDSYTEVYRNVKDACQPVKNQIEFFCEGCGRLAPQPEEVCLPAQLDFRR